MVTYINFQTKMLSGQGVLVETKITCLKSASILFCKLSVNGYALGLSNDLLFIIIDHGTEKLYSVKVGGSKKLPYVLPAWVNLLNKM